MTRLDRMLIYPTLLTLCLLAATHWLPVGAVYAKEDAASATFDLLTAERIVIQGPKHDAVTIYANAEGGVMEIRSAAGKKSTTIRVTPTGGGFVVVADAGGEKAALGVMPNGSGSVGVSHASGDKAATITSDSEGRGGRLALWTSKGALAAEMGVDEPGAGYVVVGNRAGKPVVALRSNESGGTLNVMTNESKTAAYIQVEDGGSGSLHVTQRGANPATISALIEGQDAVLAGIAAPPQGGGFIAVMDRKGTTASVVMADRGDGGFVQLAKKNGQAVLVLATNDRGGEVTVRDEAGRLAVNLSVDVAGGRVSVGAKKGKGGVLMATLKEGGGVVGVMGVKGQADATLRSKADGSGGSVYKR